jgi:hypothetical protein
MGDLLVAKPPPGFNRNDVSTSIQIAIWTIENGSVSTYHTASPAVANLTSQYIYDAANVWAPYFSITTFSSADGNNDNQTLAMVSELANGGHDDRTTATIPRPAGGKPGNPRTPMIPELRSWLMVLIGFVGIGIATVSRRKATELNSTPPLGHAYSPARRPWMGNRVRELF